MWTLGSGPRFGTDPQWFHVHSSDGDPIQAQKDLWVRGPTYSSITYILMEGSIDLLNFLFGAVG